jgi:ATP-dependent DNA helicase RecQ
MPSAPLAQPSTAGGPDADADLRREAGSVLGALVGRDDAVFRDGQWEAVHALVARRRRVLVVQRTGWGKSAVYFVASALLRARGAGPTLLVSPLLALMRDQVAAARRAGVRAVTMNSANAHEWGEVTAALAADEVDVLLVSPERLVNPRFAEELAPRLLASAGLVVVDEAHCVSDWGHDFRPDYRRIRDLLAAAGAVPVLATTATANSRVVADVADQLTAGGHEVDVVRGPLARASLRLGVLDLPNDPARLAWLAAHLADLPGSGIIYCLTVAAAEDTAAVLRDAGHTVLAYTGRTDAAEREEAEQALRQDTVKALVATSALGMGFDKPDLGFVVHLGSPASPVAYYQQVGRAGRAVERADVLLLPGAADRDVWKYFATASMPRPEQADAVLAALAEAPKPISTAALEGVVDVRRTRLELLLKVLAVEGAVDRVGGGWRATGRGWTYDAERYERVRRAREDEQALMREYQGTSGCRMAFLQRVLDDDTASDCGRCDRCAGPWYPGDVPAAALDDADRHLARVGVPVEPRRQWPTGMTRLGVDVSGRLPAEEQVEPGRAVARFTDLGWGQVLRQRLDVPDDQVVDGPVPDDLLAACVEVLAGWGWRQRPSAVAAVGSRTRPRLVTSLAAALAERGRLPYLGALRPVPEVPRGRRGGNSAFRLAAVWGGLEIPADMRGALPALDGGPVLLVDDVVDSRWTMTVAGRALRRAGAGAVLPFALALAA